MPAVDHVDSLTPAFGGDAPERMVVNRCPTAIGAANHILMDMADANDTATDTLQGYRSATSLGAQR